MTDTSLLSCIEIDPPQPAQASIIWLHGLGADGNDFVSLVPELKLPEEMSIRFIFPHAPVMPVTINNGYQMRAWFDIYGTSLQSEIDHEGIFLSSEMIGRFIANEEARGIPSDHILLAGFSQGAVIALTTGLRHPKPLAGIIALSGCLPAADVILQKQSAQNRQIPIFMAHGTEDAIVPYAFGKTAYTILAEAGYPISWHHYAMPHSLCYEEIKDLREWIIRTIPAPQPKM